MWIDSQVFKNAEQKICTKIFAPPKRQIVLGRSNKAEQEVFVERANEMKVPITKRRGGGGTVLLYPGCVVISVGAWMKDRFRNDHYFKAINGAVLDVTKSFLNDGTLELAQKGISDLALKAKTDGEFKKFCGTSLFRSRNYLLYQASILFNLSDDISSLLRAPSKQPDYRRDRSHTGFLTGLAEHTSASIANYIKLLDAEFETKLTESLGPELIGPPQEQRERIAGFALEN
jgi:lipoate-protein ligase A